MKNISIKLAVDPIKECQQIEQLIQSKLDELGRSGVIIGISGGLDSAVALYLAVHSVGKERVTAFYIPDRDSKAVHREHAEMITSKLGVKLEIIDLSPILKALGVYELLPIRYVPTQRLKAALVELGRKLTASGNPEDLLLERLQGRPDSLISKANAYLSIKHRMRMVILYYHAEIRNLMVVGAANKTELLTGTFSKWGVDQCADVMPIIHLYRSQIDSIANYLQIPEAIRTKSADPDVLPGLDDKELFLGSFSETDQILWGLENGHPREELIEIFGEDTYMKTHTLWKASRHMRESPYQLIST